MKVFHKEFIAFLSAQKKWLIIGTLFLFIVVLKYGFFFLNYDKYFKIVTIATFGVYFTALFGITTFLIKKKKIILVNFSILFILLFIGEIVCFFVLGMPKKEWKDFSTPDLAEDHIGTHLGHVPWADSVKHDFKKVGDKIIFDTPNSIDKINRRTPPG
jgi:hypothetical protein